MIDKVSNLLEFLKNNKYMKQYAYILKIAQQLYPDPVIAINMLEQQFGTLPQQEKKILTRYVNIKNRAQVGGEGVGVLESFKEDYVFGSDGNEKLGDKIDALDKIWEDLRTGKRTRDEVKHEPSSHKSEQKNVNHKESYTLEEEHSLSEHDFNIWKTFGLTMDDVRVACDENGLDMYSAKNWKYGPANELYPDDIEIFIGMSRERGSEDYWNPSPYQDFDPERDLSPNEQDAFYDEENERARYTNPKVNADYLAEDFGDNGYQIDKADSKDYYGENINSYFINNIGIQANRALEIFGQNINFIYDFSLNNSDTRTQLKLPSKDGKKTIVLYTTDPKKLQRSEVHLKKSLDNDYNRHVKSWSEDVLSERFKRQNPNASESDIKAYLDEYRYEVDEHLLYIKEQLNKGYKRDIEQSKKRESRPAYSKDPREFLNFFLISSLKKRYRYLYEHYLNYKLSKDNINYTGDDEISANECFGDILPLIKYFNGDGIINDLLDSKIDSLKLSINTSKEWLDKNLNSVKNHYKDSERANKESEPYIYRHNKTINGIEKYIKVLLELKQIINTSKEASRANKILKIARQNGRR